MVLRFNNEEFTKLEIKGGQNMYVEYKRGEKFAQKNADISDDHSYFQDAGWILTEDDYIVDIDDLPKSTIEELIRFFNIKTQIVWTDRGCHFYFKKPSYFKRGANRISPLGFKYEIKHIGNTKDVTIKRNGKLRQIENEGIREDAPFIFNSNKKFDVLFGYSKGDGRNNALFKLRSRIATHKDWRKIISFVNEHIFAEPLSDEEFLTVTREEVVFSDDDDNEYEVASYLMRELDFLQYGQRYYFKDGDDYSHEESILNKRIYEKVGAKKTRYVDEVKKQMQYRCKKIPQDTIFNIRFKNGYLDSGEFVELITEDFTPYNIDIDYNPEAKHVEAVDNYINHLTGGDEAYKKLLLEVLGHTLIVDPEFKRLLAKFFIFVGDGGNGKGTLLTIIRTILGTKNVSGMSISELTDERYLTAFKGKLANLGDDLQDNAINDKGMKILKNLSTCDYISTRELYKTAENMYFTGSLIFTSNHILKSWEKGESYKRRVVWLPMYSKVTKKDPLFITKLTTDEALEYWIKLIIDGYFRLYENGKFTVSPRVESFNEEYHKENNPSLEYVDRRTAEDFKDIPVREVYDHYKEWCEDNAVNFSEKMIRDTLQNVFNLTSVVKWVNGMSVRCFGFQED